MRVVLLCLVIVIAGCGRTPEEAPAVADPGPARVAPRYRVIVRCFDGPADSGRSGSWEVTFSPQSSLHSVTKTSGRIGPPDGPMAEVEWACVGHLGEGDIYRVTFRYPVDAPDCRDQTTEVKFTGKRVVVFEDELHCVVLDPLRP